MDGAQRSRQLDEDDQEGISDYLRCASESDLNIVKVEPQLENMPLSKRGILQHILAAGAADLSSVGLGLVFGYSAVALPQLEHQDSWLVITKDQSSWIASLPALSLSVGCILSGVFMERWGRRTTLQLQCVPSALGWALIASARDVPQLYAGRLLTGLGGGMVDATCQVYLSEISRPSVRGAIGASSSLCFTFGVLLAYILGCWRLTWPTLAAASTIPPVLGFLALFFVPESPVWLVARGRITDAQNAVQWLQGNADQKSIDIDNREGVTARELFSSLMSRQTARPLLLLLVFFIFQQFCGMNAVVFYAVSMFQSSSGEESTGGLDSHQSAVVIGLTRFIMTAGTCALLTRVGRRPLALASGLGMAIAMFALGTALYLQHDVTRGPNHAIVLPCLVLFIASNTVGFFPVPWVMLGELLPERCRGIASGLISAFVYAFVFVVVKTYPLMLTALGQAGAFWVYGAVAMLGLIYVFVLLPETHKKTLEDIEMEFRKT